MFSEVNELNEIVAVYRIEHLTDDIRRLHRITDQARTWCNLNREGETIRPAREAVYYPSNAALWLNRHEAQKIRAITDKALDDTIPQPRPGAVFWTAAAFSETISFVPCD